MKTPIIGLNVDFSDGKFAVRSEYVDSIIAVGGFPLIVPCHHDKKLLDKYVAMADGFIFIGGLDYPPRYYGAKQSTKSSLLHERRAKTDLYLAKKVLACKLPVLGICGGHQLISIALGGKLVQHVPNAERHKGGVKHPVVISGGRILRGLFGSKKIMVNSYHHQAVETGALGAGLEAVAFSDGGRILEAFESLRHPFVLGLQWHPERMPWRRHGRMIFNALVKAAGKS